MEILNFILEEALIMIPAIFILTEVVKATKLVEGRYLLLVALFISLILTPWYLGGWIAENIVQAILVMAGAVLIDNGVKQFVERKDK